jgi:hypothetical protein
MSEDEYVEELHPAIAECRACRKLIRVEVDWQQGKYVIMTTGRPLFGKCPSTKEFPACGEKYADRLFMVEDKCEDGGVQVVIIGDDGEVADLAGYGAVAP